MNARPATSTTLREINLRAVLDVIRAGAPISRAEVARRTGISKPTVSALLQDLLDMALVTETVREELGPTYGAVFFAPQPEAAYVLALDVGARRLRAVLADLAGGMRLRRDIAAAGLDAAGMVRAAARIADELTAEAGVDRGLLQHAVVGLPGVVDRREGRVWQAANIPALDGFPVQRAFEEALGLPVTAENDIHLAALGEQWRGVGRDVSDFCFLSVGTGVGAGLVLRGELHRGFAGAAGELDLAFPDGYHPDDPCAPALLRHACELLPAEPGGLTPEALFDRARAGDRAALAVVSEEARRIAAYVVPVASVVDVELVVLGGGIGLNGDLLLERVARRLAGRLPYPPRVAVSALGNAAVLTGAVSVGVRAALEQILGRRFDAPGHRRPAVR
ncbi:ROK family transcriptional regulator [Streptomyces sp. NPDC092296]|uniref:ROK family transcriptional regulator n=1 Tax=Streptomyces sp. NPDC092296 TaxID=3366012 RepID=UPI0037FF3C66